MSSGAFEDFIPVFAQQSLVRCDNILACFEQAKHHFACGMDSSHQFYGDLDIRIIDDRFHVVRQDAWG